MKFVPASNCRAFTLALLLTASSILACAAELPDAPVPQNGAVTGPQTSVAPVPAHRNGIGDILFPDRFTVDPGVETQPLTVKQKFGGYAREQLGLTAPLGAALSAAISQGLDTDPKYGQGWEAYGKRTGALFVEGESVAFLRGGFFPTLLHQDPRYYRQGAGGLMSRSFYAVTRTLITRQDSGKKMLNFSALAAAGGGAGLTLAYYPDQSQTTSQVLWTFAGNIGGIAGANWLREFGPEIKHKLFRTD
jgi:hypothetical protein